MRNWLLLMLCGGCAATQGQRRAAEEVVWRSLSAAGAAERREATRIVVEVADPTLDPGLAARLGDPDAEVRAIAAAALAGEVEAARAILRQALTAPDAGARVAALDGVTALPDAAELLARAGSDGDEAVRARSAWMLAKLKDAAAVEKLLGDAAPGVRAEALRALATLDVARAAERAQTALADPSLAVRLAALTALQRGGDRARLIALAGAADRWVALRAAVHLRNLDAVERAAADPLAELRAAAMNAAGELGEAARPLAQRLLGDRDLEVRLAAARAVLSSGGDQSAAVRVLASALNTPYRLQAADELARLGDAAGRRALSEAARARDTATRRAALSSLAAISPEPPELAAALADPDAGARLIAARALLRRALRPYLR